VLRGFDAPDQPWLPGHRGVDLGAADRQDVRSPAAGVVTFSGRIAGRGVVVVRHEDGLRSTFEPVDPGVAVGTLVARGDRIGVVSSTPGHCAPATCVHWGVLRASTYVDPLSLLGRAPVILLPLD
jgi:murein DD-endopeptidase MepM/ murein hydrolase activator NlpD